MPLFMDRHDVPGVTAEQVAQAHTADLEMGAKFGVQFLAYWFDADQGEAFCLAKAPSGDSLTSVHQATHGLIPNEIIRVSEDSVLRLLGRMSESGGDTPAVNPFRTILFTDLEGSTAILESVGQSAFMVLLTEHDLIIRRALVASHGREVKHTGDGIMASFDDVAGALDFSIAVRAQNSGCGSGSPPANPSTTTTTCSGRRSPWPAGSVVPPRPGGSWRRTSFVIWAVSAASGSIRVATWP